MVKYYQEKIVEMEEEREKNSSELFALRYMATNFKK